MWRWSKLINTPVMCSLVFSTYVEVIPKIKTTKFQYCSILHVCGGDPQDLYSKFDTKQYSPRMWRWSSVSWYWGTAKTVFSTYVEVIPVSVNGRLHADSILHVCGGDPPWSFADLICASYSPRMWRWSLTGLNDGSESWGILHVCGGDPYWAKRDKAERAVFSTYVEVILTEQKLNQFQTCILHVCGGDPLT